MADVSEVNEVKPAEKYKSTKLLSGVGGFEIGGLIGTVASLPFGLSALKDVMKSHDASEGITRGDRTKFLVKLSTLLVLPLVGGIIGAVTGYRRGKKAEEQYNSVSKDLAISQAQVGHLTNTISEKDTQLAASEKRFTDVISSRQHHGGHAGAVHADAAQAAEMEMAR